MLVSDREYAGSDGRGYGLPVAGGDQPRRSARWSARAVIRNRYQDRIQKTPLILCGKTLLVQKKHRIGKRPTLH